MIKKTLGIIGLTAVGSIGLSNGLVQASDEPASKIDNNKTTTDSKEKSETKDKTVTTKDITEESLLNETKELAEKLDYTKKVENFDVVTLNKNVSAALDLLKSSNLTDTAKVDEKIKLEAQKEKEETKKQEQSKKTAQPVTTQSTTQATTQTTNISSAVEESNVDTSTVIASSTKGAAIYQAALSQIGRYQDCTMLVTNALKSVGINFHDWPSGYFSLGTVVPASQAQPGDLIYYANGGLGMAHIAVYAGNGQAIHGGWSGNQTVLNSANVGSGPIFIRVR